VPLNSEMAKPVGVAIPNSIKECCVSTRCDRDFHWQPIDFWIDAIVGNCIMSALLRDPFAAIAISMQESIGHIIWSACYLSVLIGLSGLWDPSLFHHLFVFEKPKAAAGSGSLL
jgi:hypothetical protein